MCQMIWKLAFKIIILFRSCVTKKLLIETKPTFDDRTIVKSDERLNGDYMMDVDVQTVNVGNPVELKCNSPTKFSACYFSKTGENTLYRMQSKATFLDKRLQCLCDVSPRMFMI